MITGAPYPYGKPENTLYTVCLQCNTGCGIKVLLERGVAVKVDGNPLSPWTMAPHLPYQTPAAELAPVYGMICPKGQAGIQTVYDPYRIRHGTQTRRPAGRQQVDEHPVGAGDQRDRRAVGGFSPTSRVRKPRHRGFQGRLCPARSRAGPLDDRRRRAGQDKRMTIEQFKAKYRANLHVLIDPDHPDLGPKNNQFVFMWGRVKGGRGDFVRAFRDAFGSANAHGHTTVCQGSLYFTGKAMSEQFVERQSVDGGRKFYWQADTESAEFIIFVGASPLEANYGPPTARGRIAHEGIADGASRSRSWTRGPRRRPARPGSGCRTSRAARVRSPSA